MRSTAKATTAILALASVAAAAASSEVVSSASKAKATTTKKATTVKAASTTTAAVVASSSAAAAAPAAASSTGARDTWQDEALITSPTEECTYYSYEPVNDLAAVYPTIWATASLNFTGVLASDIAVFTAMEAGIPNIAPKGTRAGDFSTVSYNSTDPDCWWTWDKCTTPKDTSLVADTTKCDEPLTWGFTLDDGPNCSHNAYYDYLKSVEQTATLFYIGSNVMDWPLEAQRGLGDGHEICVHTWSHPYMTAMTNEEAFAELYFAKKAIHDVLGITVQCWRPPFGDVDDRIRYIATKLGLRTIIWTDDTDDWDYTALGVADVESNYNAIINKAANNSFASYGPIVLTHELDNETMSLSQQFLPAIQKAFTGGVMPVGTCQNWTEPYGEGSGYVYPNYAQWAAGTRSVSLADPTAATTEVAFASAAVVTSTGLPAGASTIAVTKASGTGKAAASSGASAAATGTTSSGAASVRAGLGLIAAALLGAIAIF